MTAAARFLPLASFPHIGLLKLAGAKPVAARFFTPAEAKALAIDPFYQGEK